MAPPKSTHPVEIRFETISKYHWYIFTLLFTAKIPVFWHMINLIFLGPEMTYTCGTALRATDTNPCPCDNPIWDRSIFTKTMQTKFNLICDRKMLMQPAHSCLYLGTLIGAMSFGFLCDRYGRLLVFCLTCLLMGVFGCLVAFMNSITTFMIMRLLEGIALGGAIISSYVLCVEYCGITKRELVTALYHLPLNVGHGTLAGVSYLLRDMDHYQIALSLPVIVFCIMYFICLESPKWQMDRGNIDKAAETMEKIAKFNGTSYGNIKAEMVAYQAAIAGRTTKKEAFCDIFKHKKLITNFGCMAYIYFVCGMGYYGVSQYIGRMSSEIHKNVSISGFMLLPATLCCVYLLQKLSRRTFLILTSIASGALILSVVLIIPQSMSGLKVFAACLGNCFFFMSFIIVFLYGVELFPTSVRSSVLGTLSLCSRTGQIMAPFINAMSPKVAGIVFGILAILGGVLCLPLPETKGKELPSTMEDYK